MTETRRHLVVTGAGGFIGGRLAAALLDHPSFAGSRLTLNDLKLGDAPADPRVRAVEGDLRDPAVRTAVIDGRADVVFHVAAILGGAAEADRTLARAVNVEATLSLLEDLADAAAPPRVVFTSSIAVFGHPVPEAIDDGTPVNPMMAYGAHKAMVEIAVEQMSARGWIDGLAPRLPGVAVKPGADARMRTAFLNRLFEVFAEGADLTLPVPPDGTTWLLSTPACVEALVHAGALAPERLGRRRAFNLPAQNVRFDALVEALHRRHPESPTRIAYAPDPAIEAQFGRQPPLTTPFADVLGFRHDGDLATLVERALSRSL